MHLEYERDVMKLSINKSITEEELINSCKKQDQKALRDVYHKYCDRMFGLCIRYVKDKCEAEDIMIKGFVTAFEKIGQYLGDGPFEGWLRRIMINECLGFLRKNKHIFMAVDLENAEVDPDCRFLNDDLETAELLAMIDLLPDGYRAVFNLYAIEGYSHKEISQMLSIGESTSKSQLSRARACLQKLLKERENRLDKKFHENEKA